MTRALLYEDAPPYYQPPPPRPPQPEPKPQWESSPPPAVAAPPPPPRLPVDMVFATAVLSPLRLLAVFYWARSKHYNKPLILLDFHVSPLLVDSWEVVNQRLADLTVERRARMGNMGCFVEGDHLIQHAQVSGMRVHLIPEYLVSDDAWQIVCQSSAGFMSRSDVGMVKLVQDKMNDRPFLDAAGSYVGPRPDDPAIAAFLFGVIIGLDEAASRDPKAKPPKPSRRN